MKKYIISVFAMCLILLGTEIVLAHELEVDIDYEKQEVTISVDDCAQWAILYMQGYISGTLVNYDQVAVDATGIFTITLPMGTDFEQYIGGFNTANMDEPLVFAFLYEPPGATAVELPEVSLLDTRFYPPVHKDNSFYFFMHNNLDSDVAGRLIVAIYEKDNDLVLAKIVDVELDSGSTYRKNVAFRFDDYDYRKQYSAKIFMWSDTQMLRAISKSITR